MIDDAALQAWEQAWLAPDEATLAALVERALEPDGELVDPLAGRFRGHDAVVARLRGFAERFPGARVTVTTGVDRHHEFARYAWTIVAADGAEILEGIDVVEAGPSGRLRRIVMFFGSLPPRTG
jgi:SnoaL-like domain